MSEFINAVNKDRTGGKSFHEFRYQLTRIDDLISATQRFEEYANGEGLTISDWQEEFPGTRGQHAIKAAIVWDDRGRQSAISQGYSFATAPNYPEIEEEQEIERKLAESMQDQFTTVNETEQ